MDTRRPPPDREGPSACQAHSAKRLYAPYVEVFSTGARYVEQPSQVAEYERVFTVLMDWTESIEEWQQ